MARTTGKQSTVDPEAIPVVSLTKLDAETLRVPIIGTAPLIIHRFDEKARRKMLGDQQSETSTRTKRDPQGDYERAFYRFDDGSGYGMPALAFKRSIVSAARYFAKMTMTDLRQFVFVLPHGRGHDWPLVRITGEPAMREDTVRLTGKTCDLRYRPAFFPWSVELQVTYVTSNLSRGSVLSLIDAAGLGVGVGEWRPERNGESGTFRIDPDRAVEVL